MTVAIVAVPVSASPTAPTTGGTTSTGTGSPINPTDSATISSQDSGAFDISILPSSSGAGGSGLNIVEQLVPVNALSTLAPEIENAMQSIGNFFASSPNITPAPVNNFPTSSPNITPAPVNNFPTGSAGNLSGGTLLSSGSGNDILANTFQPTYFNTY